MGQNETQRHFELRNIDKDMEKAAKDASYVMTKGKLRRIKAGNVILLFVLAFLVVLACFLLGAF
jgi:hypothetical protein